jgi:hypothetical protein
MNQHLFSSLRKQLVYEILFVNNVSSSYHDPKRELEIVDFEYKGQQCKLVLNGKITLETRRKVIDIESYHDLIKGLMELQYSQFSK